MSVKLTIEIHAETTNKCYDLLEKLVKEGAGFEELRNIRNYIGCGTSGTVQIKCENTTSYGD